MQPQVKQRKRLRKEWIDKPELRPLTEKRGKKLKEILADLKEVPQIPKVESKTEEESVRTLKVKKEKKEFIDILTEPRKEEDDKHKENT